MQNVQNSQKKADMLENELLKIDHELFELEKKYGEFNIKKGSLNTTLHTDSSKHNTESIHAQSPEEPSKFEELKQESPKKWGEAPPIENSQFAIPTYDDVPEASYNDIPRRFKSEVDSDI
jgi:hypothetical protein